jgi:hypothetical protein
VERVVLRELEVGGPGRGDRNVQAASGSVEVTGWSTSISLTGVGTRFGRIEMKGGR